MRILIFSQKDWAFGAIHNTLAKKLLPFGISCDFLDWSVVYDYNNFNMVADNYDYILTGTGGAITVLKNNYNIPLEKIIGVAHAKWDLEKMDEEGIDYNKLYKLAAVHEDLVDYAKEIGVTRAPDVVRNGVDFDFFYSKLPERLNTIGYGAKFEGGFGSNKNKGDIKRGFLVKKLSETFKNYFDFKFSGGYHYLAMPSFYRSVDAVICTSTEESCGLPMLEAACAGRLCLSTKVGYFQDHENGILLPMEEDLLINKAQDTLIYYKNYPHVFRKTCKSIQDYAREHFDWSKHIFNWVQLFY